MNDMPADQPNDVVHRESSEAMNMADLRNRAEGEALQTDDTYFQARLRVLRRWRVLLLSAWAGEEKGLLGSRYYVSHPVFPLNRTDAMFQMDMIGRCEESVPGENPGNETAEDNLNTVHLIGARSNQTHAAVQNVEELWQFIKAGLAQ